MRCSMVAHRCRMHQISPLDLLHRCDLLVPGFAANNTLSPFEKDNKTAQLEENHAYLLLT